MEFRCLIILLFFVVISLSFSSKIALKTFQTINNQLMFPNAKIQGDTILVDKIKYEFKKPVVFINNTFDLNFTDTSITFANNSTISSKNIGVINSNLTGGERQSFYFNTLNITNSTFIFGNNSLFNGLNIFIWNSNVTYGKTFNKTEWRGKWTVLNATVNGVRFRNGSANYTAYNEYITNENKAK